MKSFQPKAEGSPPDDEGPGAPPTPSIPPDNQPTQSDPETEPMPHPNHRNRNAEVDFKGEKRSDATHASTRDPDARLYEEVPRHGCISVFHGPCADGEPARSGCSGRLDAGPLSADCCAIACGDTERRAAIDMLHRHSPGSTRRLTLGADKGYDAAGFVPSLRQACVTPHVAQKSRYSAIPSRRMRAFACRAMDGRATRHQGCALSIRHRKRIDLRRENDPPDRFLFLLTFGWAKTVGGMAQTVYRGVERVRSRFILTMAANNPRRAAP